jgi:plasmid stabilization system protein ParE
MAFQVIVRPQARSDIAAAMRWLAGNSLPAAARWRTGLLQIVDKLETDPTHYPEADEAGELGVDLRQLLYGRRRNMFTIDGQTVNVLRVRHAAQDWLTLDDFGSAP